ncbi:UDP-xylose and UDP-N-acetylglucosamine transporter-like isoform X2 [Neocloeon triangulifer]|uniref:UDP-xylose and UDP-N-acetylglucosamine transporter-like isoform X2 n=1 Tax=Neocloeon triangulifer TaxID=2078957 RepID=UPI00286ED389|nr:UDP-xylose and UDP-N-acetylglucosamine transporter-like isoform X2 [Neocloeon triangulifer]
MEPGGLIFFIFLGCCTNVFFMEILIKQDPGIGTLVTFTQYLFNSIYGFIFSSKFGTKKPEIKLSEYVALVLLLFAANICNNCAFLFNISMPLHMIFKSGSLTANLILGMMILKRSYSNVKIASVITITIGIAIFSVQSGSILKSEVHNEGDNKEVKSDYRIYGMDLEYMKWLFGVSLLLVALFLSARMGIYQEVLFKTYGRHSSEALFYTHLLPLPAFLVIAPDLLAHWHLALHSPIMIFFGHEFGLRSGHSVYLSHRYVCSNP